MGKATQDSIIFTPCFSLIFVLRLAYACGKRHGQMLYNKNCQTGPFCFFVT